MKKTILIAVMALISLTVVSCGNTGNNESKTLTAATQTVQEQRSAEMSKKDFLKIPDEAEDALDAAAKRTEGVFETQGDRSFGYTGTAEVNGAECYCFSLFDKKDDNTYHVADIAVTTDGGKVYSAKAGKKDYSELVEPVRAKGWSEKNTPAFSK